VHKSTLVKYNVHPISHIFYNDTAVKASDLAYCYVETKDNKVSYKIYQPLEPKIKKWINNADYTVHQGYMQLPKQGELLIITKSLKDVMSIYDCLGISAVGLQSESVMMKSTVMEEYKTRFKKVICLFDNDEAGKKLSLNFTNTYGIPHIFMPELPKVTDFSDLVKHSGVEKAVETFKKIIDYV
jgi:5S rRNA maturation endonuclease (ribonuclease M5)